MPTPSASSIAKPARRRLHGFTLVEMLVTIAVLTVLLAVAVPSFDGIRVSSRLSNYATALVAASQTARSEAIKRNVSVTLCVSTNGSTCATDGAWEGGWIVLAGATVLLQQPAAASGYLLREAGGASALTFDPTGVGATQATLTICRASPSAEQERVVTISATGRSTVKTTRTGTCTG